MVVHTVLLLRCNYLQIIFESPKDLLFGSLTLKPKPLPVNNHHQQGVVHQVHLAEEICISPQTRLQSLVCLLAHFEFSLIRLEVLVLQGHLAVVRALVHRRDSVEL